MVTEESCAITQETGNGQGNAVVVDKMVDI